MSKRASDTSSGVIHKSETGEAGNGASVQQSSSLSVSVERWNRNDAVSDWLPEGALCHFLEVCEEHGHDLLWRVGLGSFSARYLRHVRKLGQHKGERLR
jgi:hypothetical protein